MPSTPLTVRVALIRCSPENFALISDKMEKSEKALRPGIEAMPGLLAFYAGADAETLTLTNVSLWDSVEHAKQLDTFAPMVALAREFIADGGRPERPVMNHVMQWSFGPRAIDASALAEVGG
jgi:hypothetical protein